MPTLASVAELAAYTGQQLDDDDPQALLMLESATAVLQTLTRQYLFFVADDTVTLPGGTLRVELPERPAVGTPTVEGVIAPLTLSHSSGVLTYAPTYAGPAGEHLARFPSPVTVTYSHGFETIPDDLRHACLSIASRLLSRAQQGGGQQITQETIGSYSVTYARGNALELTVDERAVVSRYRRTARSAQQ